VDECAASPQRRFHQRFWRIGDGCDRQDKIDSKTNLDAPSMQTSILAAIATAKAQNRFVSDRELQAEAERLKQDLARLEAASLLFNQAQSLIDAALQALEQKFSHEAATSESQEKIRLEIENYLHLIQYSLVTNSTEEIDDYLSDRQDEITDGLNLSVDLIVETLNCIKADRRLSENAAIAAHTYIEYTIDALLKLKETQNKEENSDTSTVKPFWERLAEIGAQVPESEWAKIPRDLATNFEHYMYGAPKEE
jgi:Phycobilisome protein